VVVQEVEDQVARQRTVVSSSNTHFRSLSQAVEELQLELQQCQRDRDGVDDSLAALEPVIRKLGSEIEALEARLHDANAQLAAVAAKEEERRRAISSCEREMKELIAKRDAARKVRLCRLWMRLHLSCCLLLVLHLLLHLHLHLLYLHLLHLHLLLSPGVSCWLLSLSRT
jgi:septal ring factor EnvC (AmiA/AmiB activator)